MSVIATALKHLIAAGVSGDDLVRAVAEMEAAMPVHVDKTAEKRRAWDRERKRNSGGIPPEYAETLPPYDNTSTPHLNSPKDAKASLPPKPKRIGAMALPDNWQPEPFGLTTKSRGIVDGWPPGELETQLEHFRAHHRSKGSKFKDWQDAWSTWTLNSRRFGASNGRSRQPLPKPRNAILAEYLRSSAELAAEHEAPETDFGAWPAISTDYAGGH